MYSHQTNPPKESDDFEKLLYIYQHFQDSEKMHQIEPERELITLDDNSLYLYVNNDIEYRLFEDIVDSNYLDSQIKDNFQCNHDCYSQHRDLTCDNYSNACTHDYHHITQNIQDLTDSTQQNTLHSMEENASSFADDTDTHCDFSIIDHTFDTGNANDKHTCFAPKYPPFTHKENTHTETLLAMHTYSTMTLTIKTHLHLETNIPHYYNKNYKIHIGIYMTQLRPKVTKFPRTWT